MKVYSEDEGKTSESEPSKRLCPKCNLPMTHQTWESSDGGYEDSKFTCTNPNCGHVVWIDGIDS